jgi:hypothetical protein
VSPVFHQVKGGLAASPKSRNSQNKYQISSSAGIFNLFRHMNGSILSKLPRRQRVSGASDVAVRSRCQLDVCCSMCSGYIELHMTSGFTKKAPACLHRDQAPVWIHKNRPADRGGIERVAIVKSDGHHLCQVCPPMVLDINSSILSLCVLLTYFTRFFLICSTIS